LTADPGPQGYPPPPLVGCTLAGYSVFTPGADGAAATCSVRGEVSAYVQFKQAVPAGWKRLGGWPGDLFAGIAPPPPDGRGGWPAGSARPRLTKLPFAIPGAMENTPVVWGGRPLLVLNERDDTKVNTDTYASSMHLFIKDMVTGREVARFGEGHSFASAIVAGPELNVFASEGGKDWFRDIYRFTTTDLKAWKRELALKREGGEALLNVSVCRDDRGYLMAYESNKPVSFCFKFARSTDLARWEKIPGLIFAGAGNEYSACPVIRFVAPYYYAIYLHEAPPGRKGWVSYLARSRDLAGWELSPLNPVLEAADGEGLNNSDVDILERDGKTYLYYATGDQSTWSALRVAEYDGPLAEFFPAYFPPGQPSVRVRADARR
jgi:hypothetical protein